MHPRDRDRELDDAPDGDPPVPCVPPAPAVDARAIAELLRREPPAGRGAATMLARALDGVQPGYGNAVVARVLKTRGRTRPAVARVTGSLLQRSLIATGSDADFDRFRALAEPACGLVLGRDAATHAVTAIGSRADPATSPAFANILTRIIDAPLQDAAVHFGAGAPGVTGGAFPIPRDMTGSRVQTIDIDDMEAIEAGAPGHGVAALAHELQENFAGQAAGAAAPAPVDQFPAAHQQGNAAQGAVAADLAGTGSRVAERSSAGAAAGTFVAVMDFETAFLVLEVSATQSITSSRQAGRVTVSDQTLDGFATGSDAPPAGGQIATAAADLLAHPQATAFIEGFTDDVGTAGVNDPLSRRRAEQARDAIIAANPALRQGNFHVVGRGASGFVALNLTEADRRLNRRVRIRVEEPAP